MTQKALNTKRNEIYFVVSRTWKCERHLWKYYAQNVLSFGYETQTVETKEDQDLDVDMEKNDEKKMDFQIE